MRGSIAIVGGLALAVPGGPAFAQAAKKMAEHGDWATYSYQATERQGLLRADRAEAEAKSRLSTMATCTSSSASGPARRSPSSRSSSPATRSRKVEGSVAIGAKKFSMFTKGKSAWVENAAEEPL